MRVRRIALVIAALVAVAGVAPASARARVGLEGGWDYAGVSSSLFGHLFDDESRFRSTWSAGVTLDVPLAERLTLATGLRYLEYGEQVDVTLMTILPTDPPTSVPNGTFRIMNTWRYLAVPLRVKYQLAPLGGLFASVGPELGYLLDTVNETELGAQSPVFATGVAAAPSGTIFEQIGTFDDFQDFYNRWNVTLGGGLGCRFPLLSHEGAVEVRYSEGLLDMAKSTSVTQRTRGLEAVLGLRW